MTHPVELKTSVRHPAMLALRRLRRNPASLVGLAIVVLMLSLALLAL
jgi:hypothetical protein